MTDDEIINMYIIKGWKPDTIHRHLVSSGHTVMRSHIRKLYRIHRTLEKNDEIIIKISETIHAESHPRDIRNALIEVKKKDYGI